MKKIIIPLIFAISIQFSFGQTLVDTNKLWSTIDDYDYLISGGLIPPISYYTKFNIDTIISGYTYKKIFNSTDPNLLTWIHIGYVREDSTKKVFFMDTLGIEGLVYDFDVSVGDTINFYNPLRPYLSYSVPIIVDSIYQIYFADTIRNAVDVIDSGDVDGYSKETWIEGIGNTIGILEGGHSLAEVVGWSYRLLCFYENDSLLYNNPLYTDCYYGIINNMETNNKQNIKFKIVPNPAFDKISIIYKNTDLKDIELEIYNIFGQMIKKTIIKSNDKIICFPEELKDGLYICIIKNKESILSQLKLIIKKN